MTLSRSFTPWGELLDQTGAGDATWGYLGGVLDAATGLIYVGNGQYYDPATVRFLSRGVNPGVVNPYVPWQGDPLGMLIGPLALVAVFGSKRKNGKGTQFLVLLLVVLVVSVSIPETISAYEYDESGGYPYYLPLSPIDPEPSELGARGKYQSDPDRPSNPLSPPVRCTSYLTPDILNIPYPGSPAYDDSYNAWGKTLKKYKELIYWMSINKPDHLEDGKDPNGYGRRMKDSVLLAIIVSVEFRSLMGIQGIFNELMGALSNQYFSGTYCSGDCDSVTKQVIFLSSKQGIRTNDRDWIATWYQVDLEYGEKIINGAYTGHQGWEWGNYKPNSDFELHPGNWPHVAMVAFNKIYNKDQYDPKKWAGMVVFTAAQNIACRAVKCGGF